MEKVIRAMFLEVLSISCCGYCDENIGPELPFKCKFCKGVYCGDHYLPENHDCYGLHVWKEEKLKRNVYDPIYDPFKDFPPIRPLGKPKSDPEIKSLRKVPSIRYSVKSFLLFLVLVSMLFTIWESTPEEIRYFQETIKEKINDATNKTQTDVENIFIERKTLTPFETRLLEKYSYLEPYKGYLLLDSNQRMLVPDDIRKIIFSEKDETILEVLNQKTNDCKTDRCTVTTIVNWVRFRILYDHDRAEAIEQGKEIRWRTAKDTLAIGKGVCGDQSIVLGSLLYNAGFDTAILRGWCSIGSTEGQHAWVLVRIDERDYYLDTTNERYGLFSKELKNLYDSRCTIEEIVTPDVWLRE